MKTKILENESNVVIKDESFVFLNDLDLLKKDGFTLVKQGDQKIQNLEVHVSFSVSSASVHRCDTSNGDHHVGSSQLAIPHSLVFRTQTSSYKTHLLNTKILEHILNTKILNYAVFDANK